MKETTLKPNETCVLMEVEDVLKYVAERRVDSVGREHALNVLEAMCGDSASTRIMVVKSDYELIRFAGKE